MSQTPLADQLARISRDEFSRYLQDFRPVEKEVIDSLGNSTVGKSMDAAQGDAIRARESLSRMRDRYGATITDAQAVGEGRQNALSGALGTLSAGNTAYLADRDNREQTLAGLMNTGQIIRQQALGNWTSAAGSETQRANTNLTNSSAYKQQKDAARQSNVATGVATAATIAAAMI
jgi:hypothetical protein